MLQNSLALYERVVMDFGSKRWVRIWVHSWALWVLTTCQGYGYVLIGDYGLSPHPQLGKRETMGLRGVMGFEKYGLRGFLLYSVEVEAQLTRHDAHRVP